MPKLLSDDEVFGAPATGGLLSDEDVFGVEPPKKKGRTWAEAAADTGVQLAEGVNTIAGAVPDLIAPQSGASGFFRDNADYWRDKQSDALKSRIAAADAAIARAGEDGVVSQAREAASQYARDPGLAARFVVTNLPSIIPGIGAAKAAQVAALVRGAGATRAASVATAAAGGVNAILNAGGARGDAFEDIKQALEAQGMSSTEAEERALSASVLPAAVGGVAGFVSGKTGLERSLFGAAAGKSSAKSAAAATASELAGEQLEEVAPKLATNYQAGQYDGRPLGKDVGRTFVETAIGSGPGSVVAGGAAYRQAGKPAGNEEGPADQLPVVEPAAKTPTAPDVAEMSPPVPEAAPAVLDSAPSVSTPVQSVASPPDPFARLAELELEAERRELTPAEVTEAQSLVVRLQGEEDSAGDPADEALATELPGDASAEVVEQEQLPAMEVASIKSGNDIGSALLPEVAAPPPEKKAAKIEFKPAKIEDSNGVERDGFRAEFDNTKGGSAYIELAVDGDRVYPSMVDNGMFRLSDSTGGAISRAYEQAVEFAEQNGKVFTSDDSVTISAARLYDSLERKGYSVQKSPAARLAAPPEVITDRWVTDDGSPVFTVSKLPRAIPTQSLSPEHAAQVAEIDGRLAAIAADHPNRTPAVQASLKRSAARLQAERAEITQQAQRSPQPQAKASRGSQAPIMKRDDLVGAIMRVTGGRGVAASMAQTVTGDTANRVSKLRGLFTTQGVQDLDDTAMLLREEEGYDVRDGEHLAELLREAAAGNVAVSMERAERDADEHAARQHRDAIRERARELGVKTVARRFDDIERDVIAAEQKANADEADQERLAIQAEAEASEFSEDTINELLRMAAADNDGRYINDQWITDEQILEAVESIGESEEESAAPHVIATAGREAPGNRSERGGKARHGQGGNGRGRDKAVRQGDKQSRQGDGSAELTLTGQTNEEAAADFAKQQQGEPELTKDQIDREASGFSLQQESQASPKQAPTGGQGGLFTADGRASVAAAGNDQAIGYNAEQRTKRDDYTRDLFGHELPGTALPDRGVEQPPAAQNRDMVAASLVPGARFATVAEPRQTGEIRSAFERVESAPQAAHVFAGLRKSPQERFAVLVLDKANRPIAALRLFAGATTQTGVYPEVVTKAVYETPGAASIWFAHNHPSGLAEPSRADEALTKKLSEAFGDGTGITVAGHVIIAGAKSVELDSDGVRIGGSFDIPPGARRQVIPVTERVFRKVGVLGRAITSPGVARQDIPQLANGDTGVVFTNAQNEPIAFIPLGVPAMQQLRNGGESSNARRLFGAAARSNASAAFIHFADDTLDTDAKNAANNVYSALNGRDIRVLDAFYRGAGGGMESMSERGTLTGNAGNQFESRTPSPARSGMERVRVDMVQATVDVFIRHFKGAAALDIRVVFSRDEIPPHHRPSPYADGVYHDRDGVIYLIAKNLPTKLRTWQVLMHETVGHYGLASLMGKKFAGLWQTVLAQANASHDLERHPAPGDADYPTVDAVRLLYPEADDNEIAQEVLARMAETMNPPSWARAALAKVRQWLKSVAEAVGIKWGPSMKDARDMVVMASEHLRRGDNLERLPAGQDLAFASRSGNPMESRAAVMSTAANWWERAKAKAQELTSPESLDTLIYNFQDKMIDLKRLRDRIKALQGTITDLNDAYLGEELYHGRVAKRTEEFLADELKPLLADLRASGIGMAEFEEFLHARHAPEANAELAKRNPNLKEIEAGRQKAAAEVKTLATQLQSAQAAGKATKTIEQAMNTARGELAKWNGAQAFQGTEEERLSLSGMSDAEAAAVMANIPAAKRAHFDAQAARVDAINGKTLKLLEQYGLMDKASLDAWRTAYQHYVPLHRDEAHPDSGHHPVGQGFSVKGDSAKRRTGSNEKVTHILGHIAMQREAAITRGEKNNVTKKLYLMAAQNPDKDFWLVDKPPTIKTVDKSTGFVRSSLDPLYKNKPNVVMLRIAGKDVAVVFNEHNKEAVRLAASLKNLGAGDLHAVLGLAAKGTRWFASINTQYNPIFGLINLARDAQSGILNLGTTAIADRKAEVTRGILPALRAVYGVERGGKPLFGAYKPDPAWAKLWEEFQEVGGQTGYRDLYANAEDRADALLKELKSLDRGQVGKAMHAVADWLSDYNTAMENAVRLSAYKAALDKGLSKERAASIAKNLTVNFNRKGAQAREIGALYAFFNASIQGTARMAETLAGPVGKKIIYGGVALGALQALLGMALMGGGDDDEWEKIPEFIKERSIIIPLSKEDFITIPLPLGFHVLPNIGRLATEFAFGGKDKTAGRQVGKLLGILAEAFNPIGSAGISLQTPMPTVFDPFVALAENRDWTGKPIYRENRNANDPVPGHARAKDSASTFSKEVTKAINAITGGNEYRPGAWSPTPDQLDYIIGQLTGGIGRELMKLEQTVTSPFTGDELPPHKIPLLSRLYGNTRGASGNVDKFNDNIRELNEIENEAKGRAKDRNGFREYLDSEPKIALVGPANAAENQVQKLRTYRRELVRRAAPGYKDEVKVIDERIGQVMKDLNRRVAEQERVGG